MGVRDPVISVPGGKEVALHQSEAEHVVLVIVLLQTELFKEGCVP